MDMEIQKKIQKLQMIEERLNNYSAQKQQLQATIMEYESAKEALKNSEESYKIIGTIMVKQAPQEITKEVDEKLEEQRIRLTSFEKQEEKLREEASNIQKEISEGMKQETKEEKAEKIEQTNNSEEETEEKNKEENEEK